MDVDVSRWYWFWRTFIDQYIHYNYMCKVQRMESNEIQYGRNDEEQSISRSRLRQCLSNKLLSLYITHRTNRVKQ